MITCAKGRLWTSTKAIAEEIVPLADRAFQIADFLQLNPWPKDKVRCKEYARYRISIGIPGNGRLAPTVTTLKEPQPLVIEHPVPGTRTVRDSERWEALTPHPAVKG